MTKKQQMGWSRRGAHLLLQVRLAVLEGGLRDVFRHCYPRFQMPVGREATRPRTFFRSLGVLFRITNRSNRPFASANHESAC